MTRQTIKSAAAAEAALQAAGYHLHHTASRRGYVSRRGAGVLSPYAGRFGTGFVWDRPRNDTTQYTRAEYWIK